ncbi:alpha/beta fold hydrolase [Parvibaculum sp.]|uniref:alpha/beta fold hydrolase n=1 Tax=Parvibaculum sp. TaxID=2024848 RepID=UPI00320FB40E
MAILKGVAATVAAIFLILLVFYWAAGRAKPVLDADSRAALRKQGLAHAFMDLPDGTVHYRLEGPSNGPLVVLVHGFSLPSFVFDDYVKPLTDAGYRVLAFDNYGRGLSDRPAVEYDANLTDRLILNLTDKLGLTAPAHFVGYSMGGAAAVIFAARHPERVRSLTLIAPAGLGIAPKLKEGVLARPVIGEWIARMFGLRIFHDIAAKDAQAAPDPVRFLADFDRQMDYRGYGDALVSTIRHYPLDSAQVDYAEAGRSERPVLVIWGEADETVPFSASQKLMALMPRARLHSYPGLGHNIAFSRAPLVTGLILDFLAGQQDVTMGAKTPMRIEARPAGNGAAPEQR